MRGWWCAALLLLAACQEASPSALEGGWAPTTVTAPSGSPSHGRELVGQLECARCHELPAEPTPPVAKQCVGCHQAIADGTLEAPEAVLREWRSRLHSLPAAPSLAVAGHLLRPAWIESFLLKPHDVRPHLEATMPRLPLDTQQARHIAAYLAELGAARGSESAPPDPRQVARGRSLFLEKQCDQCHAFGGVLPAAKIDATGRAVILAPDLRWARARLRPERLAAWLAAPPSLAGQHMPRFAMTRQEAEALASFVLLAPRREQPPADVPARLPTLERPVTFDEVNERVFRKTCWHCHAQPDLARGDGGPGMSGGFGFSARRLDLSTYEAINSGYLDRQGELTSLFAATAGGTPRLVAALLARQHEERGELRADLRGMPLGLPALSAEDIQLVESWIAQGRPR